MAGGGGLARGTMKRRKKGFVFPTKWSSNRWRGQVFKRGEEKCKIKKSKSLNVYRKKRKKASKSEMSKQKIINTFITDGKRDQQVVFE